MSDPSAPTPDDDGREPAASPEQSSLQQHLRAARSDLKSQLARTRADFEEANERIKARTGRDLIVAILIGLAIGAGLLLSLLIWKYAFILFAAAAAVLGVLELGRALKDAGRRVDVAAQMLGVAAMLIAATFLPAWAHWVAVCAAVVLVIVWRVCGHLIAGHGVVRDLRQDLAAGALIQLYVALTASLCVILLRQDDGQWWVLAFIIVAVASDTGAYAAGVAFGKHPMAPKISPKKTWEGFAGAVAAAVIAGILLALFMLHLPWWAGVVFGAVILCTATLGDLGESMIKRDLGIKDMSSWIPGHGGVLDRLDSILPSAVAALALYLFLAPLVITA